MDRAEIIAALTALGEALERRGLHGEMYVVGGAAIALAYDKRRSTRLQVASVVASQPNRPRTLASTTAYGPEGQRFESSRARRAGVRAYSRPPRPAADRAARHAHPAQPHRRVRRGDATSGKFAVPIG